MASCEPPRGKYCLARIFFLRTKARFCHLTGAYRDFLLRGANDGHLSPTFVIPRRRTGA